MSYKVSAIPTFKRELKNLATKFPSLKDDFALLIKSLQEDPKQGTALGNNCYKIRMAIFKGKRKIGRHKNSHPRTSPTIYCLSAVHLR